MVKTKFSPTVLFNASVVLAGLRSPQGGSGKLLLWSRQNKIQGLISEAILDEVWCNLDKVGLKEKDIEKIEEIFQKIYPAPKKADVLSFYETVIDCGDAHVLASAKETKADFLVSLDKKHILILKGKIKELKIVSPGELIKELS